MTLDDKNLYVYTFYRFIKLENTQKIKKSLDAFFFKTNLKGTILLSTEGINTSISGSMNELENCIKLIRKILRIRKLDIKISLVENNPFNRLKVRLKKEIVSLGKGYLDVNKKTGKFISPSEWDELIISNDIKLIDTRNIYEIEIGKFKKAINPMTNNFREFPSKFEHLKISKNQKIAMYCTGGIRCEKASAYLKTKGYKNIFQLDGGIINYIKHHKKNKTNKLWNGECFVFDNRVTINKNLTKGEYVQCYGCSQPLSKKDLKSKFYIKGVTCGFCYLERTDQQKRNSMTRQIQIEKNNYEI